MLIHRALRVLALAAAVAVTAAALRAEPATAGGAQDERSAAQRLPGAASVVNVVTRDTSGNTLRSGPGVFIDIGHLLVARALLADRAYSAVALYGGREQRVTAVLADDPASGLVLVAVDLPDGAPPAIGRRMSARRDERYRALGVDGTATPVEVLAAREVPGIGAVCALSIDGPQPESGTPVVDDRGQLVGIFMERAAGDTRLAFLLPTARALRMPRIEAATVAEWLRQPRPGRPDEAEAAYLHGAGALLQDRPDDAAKWFTESTRAGASDAEVHSALAASHLAAGRTEAAIASYRAAIQANPGDPRLHHDLGLALGDAGRWEEAARAFGEVVRLRPGDANAHFNAGSAYGHLGRLDDEYAAYQAALNEHPAHVKALRNLGIVCIALKRYAEAVSVSARAVRLLPSDAQLRAQLGVAYFDMGNHAAAIEELQKAIELEPGFVKAHYGLALVYSAAGRHEAALQECETLKRLDPARGAEVMKLVARPAR